MSATLSMRMRLALSLIAQLCLTGITAASENLHFDSGTHQLTLIELYTSQGCSSCPPAEHWLSKLKDDPRLWHSLIPVAFHVDYWDYLGWRDSLAKDANAKRQRRYQHEGKLHTVYTPAFVVNGKEWHSWFGLRRLPKTRSDPGRLTVEYGQGALHARYVPAAAKATPLVLHVAVLGTGIRTNIHAGENRGRVLTQDFAVLAHHQQRSDNLNWTMPLTLPLRPANGRLAIAVWVSALHEQGPLQATGGWLAIPVK